MKLYSLFQKMKSLTRKIFVNPFYRSGFQKCGKNVTFCERNLFSGIENISAGDDVHFGPNFVVFTTRAELKLGSHIMFGPGVTIITGDHRTDLVDRIMTTIRDDEKLPENDQTVTIEDNVWVGANVTILKGVTIHEGSIVAAGAVVTKDVPPYSIVGGIPAKVIKQR